MATSYDISVTKGSLEVIDITLTDPDGASINLSGYSLSGLARASYGASGHIIDLSPTVLSNVSGVARITIEPTGTAALPVFKGFYDVEYYSGAGVVYKGAAGRFTVSPEVTY
jgi:hypothetical protein